MEPYRWVPAPCRECDGTGRAIDGHPNDPYVDEVACDGCLGSGQHAGTCEACPDDYCPVSEGANLCRACDERAYLDAMAEANASV